MAPTCLLEQLMRKSGLERTSLGSLGPQALVLAPLQTSAQPESSPLPEPQEMKQRSMAIHVFWRDPEMPQVFATKPGNQARETNPLSAPFGCCRPLTKEMPWEGHHSDGPASNIQTRTSGHPHLSLTRDPWLQSQNFWQQQNVSVSSGLRGTS